MRGRQIKLNYSGTKMRRKIKLAVAMSAAVALMGCQGNPAILDGAIQGALGQVASSVGLSGSAGNSRSSDFLSPSHVRKNCRYHNNDKCGRDFGRITVTTEINRYNNTLVRYGKLTEGGSGGQLKESRVSEQMFQYIDRGLIDFDTNMYISDDAKPVRPGKYYFKGSYGSQNPALAVGDLVIKPGVTNIINVTYD